jgi:glucose-6-phosphate isomerase
MDHALDPHLHGAVEARLAGLDADQLVARLWRRDPTLWGADPARRGAITARLGWLGLAEAMEREVIALREFAAGAVADGFTHAVLLGMGGSSLAPEVLRLTLGVRPGFLELTILDDTSPAAVAAVADAHDPARTLFIVSSKSGSTLEVVSFERCFFAWAQAARRDGAGRGFVAITDPGTPLERLARQRGYRRVFSGTPDVGGRYSALSAFGLVPAALIGADLDRLLAGARAELAPLAAGLAAREVPGVRLGAALGELALRGRDKLTLLLDAPIAAFGAWVEQLVAESTGKEGRGIVPVVEESLAAPDGYGQDRVFAALGGSDAARETAGSMTALRSAGQPVLSWDPGAHGLGGEFVRWEIATATAAAILGVNPFDEPNVTEAKQATQTVLEGVLASGRFPAHPPIATARGIEAHAPAGVVTALRPHVAAPGDPLAWVTALMALARPGDYLALLAYLHRTPGRHQRLQRLRERLRAAGRLATTLGYGPRYLHSTGQLHKGGPASGLFLLLTADPGPDRQIPDERYGFAVLHRAQAEGDYAALERRGRRLLRIHLGSDAEAGLEALIASVAAAGRL